MEFHEEGIEDEMRRNLQETQATYEKLLNGFMEASQSRFLKLEESIGRLEGHVGRIADKVLSGEVIGSSDSLNFGSARAILRSGRVVNNGRNEGVTIDNNNSPIEGNDEENVVLAREIVEREKTLIPEEIEPPKGNPSNNTPLNPSFSRVPYLGRLKKDRMEQSFKDIYDVLSKVTINLPLLEAIQKMPAYEKFFK